MILRTRRRRIIATVISLLISGYLFLISSNLPKEAIVGFLSQFGFLTDLVFILLNLVAYIILPLNNAPLVVGGYLIFGPKVIFYLSLSMFLSSITNYWIGRLWGRKLVKNLAGEENMVKIDKLLKQYNHPVLYIPLRLLQGATHKFVSYALGLMEINFLIYLLVTTISAIINYFIWYGVSSLAPNLTSFLVISTILGVIPPTVFVVLVFTVKKFKVYFDV